MKNYVKGNKAAWEEAFEKAEGYGDDVVARLNAETFPFLNPEFVATIRNYDMKDEAVAQFLCNNGRELLSVVKNAGAASGVGFDIAENLIGQATRHAAATGIPCSFVATDVLKIGRGWEGKFDFALITIGALCWIEKTDDLFRIVRRCMKPGGVLLIHEIHPYTNMLGVPSEPEFDRDNPTKRVWPYFKDVPFVDAMGMSYMVGENYASKTFVSFAHTMAEILTALLDNGFRLTSFQEFPNDVSENFQAVSNIGMPLSFILTAKAE